MGGGGRNSDVGYHWASLNAFSNKGQVFYHFFWMLENPFKIYYTYQRGLVIKLARGLCMCKLSSEAGLMQWDTVHEIYHSYIKLLLISNKLLKSVPLGVRVFAVVANSFRIIISAWTFYSTFATSPGQGFPVLPCCNVKNLQLLAVTLKSSCSPSGEPAIPNDINNAALPSRRPLQVQKRLCISCVHLKGNEC